MRDAGLSTKLSSGSPDGIARAARLAVIAQLCFNLLA
jgi:hypothetical protein